MTRSGISDILPLSPLQEGLLFHALYDDDSSPDVYAAQQVLELTGAVDPAAVRAAGQALLDRHPNLRACFRRRETGQPFQIVPTDVELPWSEADLSAPDEEDIRKPRGSSCWTRNAPAASTSPGRHSCATCSSDGPRTATGW